MFFVFSWLFIFPSSWCFSTIAFQYACQSNLPSTVRILINGGANVQARHTETGELNQQKASDCFCFLSDVSLLIVYSFLHLQGMVPLHEAASAGHKEVIQVLLSMNAPVKPRTLADDIPADLARRNGHTECLKLLRKFAKFTTNWNTLSILEKHEVRGISFNG